MDNPLQSIRFVFGCSGYYDHDKGHEIDFRGRQDFQGKIIHPQV
jgi:cation diffusion facilitator CzcD-associated flavoprotein CzcO